MISQQTVSTEHINGSEFTEDCGQLRAQRSCPSKQGLQSTSLPRPPLPLGTLGIVSLLIYEKMIVMSVSDIHSYVAKYNPRPAHGHLCQEAEWARHHTLALTSISKISREVDGSMQLDCRTQQHIGACLLLYPSIHQCKRKL